MNIKYQSTIALGYFFIIALLGVVLRMFHLVDIPINYKHVVHAHSHIALLGWVYTSLTTIIYYIYLRKKQIAKHYNKLFWATQFTLIGMLISFPITGYALFSIIFSTLFLIASYRFFWFINKHISTTQKETNSYKLIRVALGFMVLSSIGPWALGIIMNTLGGASIWYRISIYFYLHFQYNGWFIIALFGIFFYVLERQGITVSNKLFKQFYWLMITSVIFTFTLSVLWTKPHAIFYILGTVGSLIQIISFLVLIKILKSIAHRSLFLKNVLTLLKLVGFLFVVKMSLQLIGSFPFIAHDIATNIDFVIGYLHWTFLGVVSISILGYLHHFKLISLTKISIWFYVIGFIITETLIFYRGFIHWKNENISEIFELYLTIASFLLLVSIFLIFWNQLKMKLSRQ